MKHSFLISLLLYSSTLFAQTGSLLKILIGGQDSSRESSLEHSFSPCEKIQWAGTYQYLGEIGTTSALFVDVLNQRGNVVDRVKNLISTDGTFKGSYEIPSFLAPGTYMLRAYTLKMIETGMCERVSFRVITENVPFEETKDDTILTATTKCSVSIPNSQDENLYGLFISGNIVSNPRKHKPIKAIDNVVVVCKLYQPLLKKSFTLRDTIDISGRFFIPVPNIQGRWNMALWCEEDGKISKRFRPYYHRHLITEHILPNTLSQQFFVDILAMNDSLYGHWKKPLHITELATSIPYVHKGFYEDGRALGWNAHSFSLYPSKEITYGQGDQQFKIHHQLQGRRTQSVSDYLYMQNNALSSAEEFSMMLSDQSSLSKSYTESAPMLFTQNLRWICVDMRKRLECYISNKTKRAGLTPYSPMIVWFAPMYLQEERNKNIYYTIFEGFQ